MVVVSYSLDHAQSDHLVKANFCNSTRATEPIHAKRKLWWCPSIAWMNMNKRSVKTLAVHS
jgi:hypothetical protein